ncbi:hypothetical protein BDV06DRAFT_190916 [Aspergillus oleicola]
MFRRYQSSRAMLRTWSSASTPARATKCELSPGSARRSKSKNAGLALKVHCIGYPCPLA